MNINLDKIDYKSADLNEMREHLLAFGDYLNDAFTIAESFALPSYFITVNKIVLCGMGASGIGAKIIKDLLVDCSKPLEIVSGYHLPAWVDKNTLVIALSHSGNTDEVLNCFVEGYQKEAKLLAITAGGKLKSLCNKYRAPIIEFVFNSEPKLAIAYLFLIPLMVLDKIGVHRFDHKSLSDSILQLNKQREKIDTSIHTLTNPAKDLATKLFGNIVCVISSENLKSVGERFSQSINEDSKQFSAFNFLPEINHNLIAGFDNPKDVLAKLIVIIIESKFASEEIKKRQNITSKILSKKNINYIRLSFVDAVDKFSEIVIATNFLSFASYYLGILNQVKPASAETVGMIKNELEKE